SEGDLGGGGQGARVPCLRRAPRRARRSRRRSEHVSAHLDPGTIAGLTMVEPADLERAVAEAHARECADCRALWDDTTARLAALDTLAAPPPPSPAVLAIAKSAVLAQLRQESPVRAAEGA